MLYRREIERREKDGLQPNRREERDKGFNSPYLCKQGFLIDLKSKSFDSTFIGFLVSSDFQDSKTIKFHHHLTLQFEV